MLFPSATASTDTVFRTKEKKKKVKKKKNNNATLQGRNCSLGKKSNKKKRDLLVCFGIFDGPLNAVILMQLWQKEKKNVLLDTMRSCHVFHDQANCLISQTEGAEGSPLVRPTLKLSNKLCSHRRCCLGMCVGRRGGVDVCVCVC